MERIEYCAEMSIRRALAFATLGIMTTMVGLVFDPVISLKSGAVLFGIVAVVLASKGYNAPRRPYRLTEVWLMLDQEHGLPEDRAQAAIGGVLRRLYWSYAETCGYIAAVLWVLGFVYRLAG